MIANLPTLTVPLQMDKNGVIRVSNTRVTLDTILACHRQGDSPEDIHSGFPTVPLTDIYAVIAYYLAHRDEVEAYLKEGEEQAERIRQEIEADYTPEQRARIEDFKRRVEQKRQQNHD